MAFPQTAVITCEAEGLTAQKVGEALELNAPWTNHEPGLAGDVLG